MGRQGLDWIRQLPAELAGQRAMLEGLLELCEADDNIRWLVIGCSLARGAGDSLSDLDVAIGVRDEEFPVITQEIRRAVGRLGDLVDSFHHQIPSVTGTHERIFAQYADRRQLDLVVFPASAFGGVPGAVILYDPDILLSTSAERRPVTPGQVREWAFRGWCALADLGKYLRRQSTWEALDRLHEARGQLWQLAAAGGGVPDPQYGLTSILDFAPGHIPAGIEATVSDLDPARLLSAAQRLAALLIETGQRLPDDQRIVLPDAMARYVTEDLSAVSITAADGDGRA
jgi:hypothetical protein